MFTLPPPFTLSMPIYYMDEPPKGKKIQINGHNMLMSTDFTHGNILSF